MTARERYDSIIKKIEVLVSTKRISARDIAESIASDQGMTYRDLATVLGFLTGEQLINYIRSRKYNAAYLYVITTEKLDINKALMIADLSDQPRLINVFNKHFGLTPRKAFEIKDASRLCPPKDWEEISQGTKTAEATENTAVEPDTIFGVDMAVYERITQINDLQALYGLDLEYSVIAVRLSDECSIDLDAAFEYVEGFKAERELILDDEEATEETVSEMMSDEWLWNNATNPSMIFCCIKCGLSVSAALWVVEELPRLGHGPVTEMSPYFIRAFREGYNIHSKILRNACEYYESHIDDSYTDEDFEEFIDRINMDHPIEIAFGEMQYEKACRESDDDWCSYDPHDDTDATAIEAFEEWASQEASNFGPRFDEEYDPDNPDGY